MTPRSFASSGFEPEGRAADFSAPAVADFDPAAHVEPVTNVSGQDVVGGRDWSPRPRRAVMPDPNLRAADSDRSAVAEQLGRHLSDGRLTVDEYEERLARVYAARTYADLEPLTRARCVLPSLVDSTV